MLDALERGAQLRVDALRVLLKLELRRRLLLDVRIGVLLLQVCQPLVLPLLLAEQALCARIVLGRL